MSGDNEQQQLQKQQQQQQQQRRPVQVVNAAALMPEADARQSSSWTAQLQLLHPHMLLLQLLLNWVLVLTALLA